MSNGNPQRLDPFTYLDIAQLERCDSFEDFRDAYYDAEKRLRNAKLTDNEYVDVLLRIARHVGFRMNKHGLLDQ